MGDMTDDQLDMDARVESSAMTPQEALAQALEAATDDPPGPVGFILTDESLAAAAIIDALPEGWLLDYRDKHVWEHALHTAKAVGAQQERKRLWEAVTPILEMLPMGYGRDPRFAALWDAFHEESME